MGKKILQPPSHTSCGLKNIYIIVFLLFQVPRLLLDGWSYQDYMSVLGSEDEIEELSNELVDVAKVKRKSVLKYHFCASVCVWLMMLSPGRLRVLTVSPWSCGVSWAATREGELYSVHGWSCASVTLRLSYRWFRKWSNMSPLSRELVHFVKHVCETLKAKKLDCILVIPPPVTRWLLIEFVEML